MNTGFIYRETSSKGVKSGRQVACNRWCAEINVSGQRKRKRSTDYQALLTWLAKQRAPRVNDARRKRHPRRTAKAVSQYRSRLRLRQKRGELTPVPGCTGYLFDIKRLTMYAIERASKIKPSVTGSYRIIDDTGERRIFMPLRLAYAILQGIDYDRIPPSYNIVKAEDGSIRVVINGEIGRETTQRGKKQNRMKILENRMRETSLIYNYYHTGDTTEVVRFALSHRRQIIAHFVANIRCGKEPAEDIFSLALERMMNTLKRPDTMLTNITQTLYHNMRVIRMENKRNIELKDGRKI